MFVLASQRCLHLEITRCLSKDRGTAWEKLFRNIRLFHVYVAIPSKNENVTPIGLIPMYRKSGFISQQKSQLKRYNPGQNKVAVD